MSHESVEIKGWKADWRGEWERKGDNTMLHNRVNSTSWKESWSVKTTPCWLKFVLNYKLPNSRTRVLENFHCLPYVWVREHKAWLKYMLFSTMPMIKINFLCVLVFTTRGSGGCKKKTLKFISCFRFKWNKHVFYFVTFRSHFTSKKFRLTSETRLKDWKVDRATT